MDRVGGIVREIQPFPGEKGYAEHSRLVDVGLTERLRINYLKYARRNN